LAQAIGLAATVLILVGCATFQPEPTPAPIPPPEPATIRFAYRSFGYQLGWVDADRYEVWAEAFSEQYPHITVELRPPFLDDWDVIASPGLWVLELVKDGSIASLDPFIEQDAAFDRSDFYPLTLEPVSIDGELWAIPSGMDVLVMYYNQDLFDQYGVAYPEVGWTWDDFLSRALALRDPAANVYGYISWYGVPYEAEYLDALSFVYQHGGRIFDDLQHPTRTTFDDPLTVEALEWYADLIHEHDVAPTPRRAGSDLGTRSDYRLAIVSGKVGMWVGPLSAQGGKSYVEWGFQWGMAPLPRGARSATLGASSNYYALSSDASSPEACWRWIDFLSRQMPIHLMPARKSLVASDEYRRSNEAYTTLQASMEHAIPIPLEAVQTLLPYRGLPKEVAILERALAKIAAGEATPDEAMSAAQRQVER
jgi:ABC-type glycerol-3-phosphate transport system substrate-binding protein